MKVKTIKAVANYYALSPLHESLDPERSLSSRQGMPGSTTTWRWKSMDSRFRRM